MPTPPRATPANLKSDNRVWCSRSVYDGSSFIGLHLEGPYFASRRRATGRVHHRPTLRNMKKSYPLLLISSAGAQRPSYQARMGLQTPQIHRNSRLAHTQTPTHPIFYARAGFTHMTHLYSCMTGVHRKDGCRITRCSRGRISHRYDGRDNRRQGSLPIELLK